MRLRRFEVRGFKNLVEPVVLEAPGGLGPISVIHGDNNIGKSNLLEAIELFFVCMNSWGSTNEKKSGERRPRELCQGTSLDPTAAFTIGATPQIVLQAALELSASDFSENSLNSPGTGAYVVTCTITQSQNPAFPWLLACTAATTGETLTAGDVNAICTAASRGHQFLRRFVHVGVHREVWTGNYTEFPRPQMAEGRRIVPPELSLALYDLYNSEDPRQVARWELLVEALKDFQDLFDGGTPVPVFRRAENRALVTIQVPNGGRIATDLLGSGLQQVIGLLGRLVVGGADVLAIEEPELNLRYDLQERLRRSLVRMANDPRVGMQMFLTSHSPAFEVGDHFFAMRKGPKGPLLERRPVEEAAAFTAASPLSTPLPHSWLSSDGVLRLPVEIQRHLGLERGGRVAFLETSEPEVLLMSNAAFGRSLDG